VAARLDVGSVAFRHNDSIGGFGVEQLDHLFESYVNQMLGRRAAERLYTPEQTAHRLSWLADQMAAHGQTIFYLERLQIDWLPQEQRQLIRFSNRLVHGLICALASGLLRGLSGEMAFLLSSGSDFSHCPLFLLARKVIHACKIGISVVIITRSA
jgi:hypothetical protein